MLFSSELLVRSSRKEEMIDITALIQEVIDKAGEAGGLCHIFVPHTTCGLTINEHYDADVAHDLICALNQIVPSDRRAYRHAEGNSPAHLKSSLMGVALTIPVAEGKLQLGTWQGIFLCEFDGPRRRRVWVRVLA